MFVIAGVTGHTGRVVAETLLAQGLPVRVLVRDEKKGASWRTKGAEVAVADIKDVRAMTAALRGATGAYLLNPPNMAATDISKNGHEVGTALMSAINEAGVGHVVFLSSIAAQHASGNGPIASVHIIEQLWRDLRAHVTFVRAGFFMENLLSSVQAMKEHGVFPTMFNPHKKAEMIATADIGAMSAQMLRAGKMAPRIVEVSGPAPTTLEQAAKAFGKALGKTLTLAPVPSATQVDVFKSFGLNDAWARAYAELNSGFDADHIIFENAPMRGLISMEQFAAQALRQP